MLLLNAKEKALARLVIIRLLFSPEQDVEEVTGRNIPDISHLSIHTIIEDLYDINLRMKWMDSLRTAIVNSKIIESRYEELTSSFSTLTQFIVDYLSATGPKHREELFQRERRFFKQMKL